MKLTRVGMALSKRNPPRSSHPKFEAPLTLTSTLSVVLIPGIGTTSPEHWPFANQDWLATLSDSGYGARVLAYEYPSPFSGANCSWESFLMLGYDLLQHLSDVRSQADQDLASGAPEFFAFGCWHAC